MNRKTKETFLENILRVEGVQGGTIHQFFDVANSGFPYAYREWNELTDVSFEFNTVKAFKKLAKKHQLAYKGGR